MIVGGGREMGGREVPDLPDDKFDLLCEVEGCSEGSPGTAAVVGVAAGRVTVAAVAGDLLLTGGAMARVERETNLSGCQRPAENRTVKQPRSPLPPSSASVQH